MIEPDASTDKLGKEYLDEPIESPIAETDLTVDEALEAEAEADKLSSVPLKDIPTLNGLYFLPNIFDRLRHLKRLYLSDNNLRNLPSTLYSCHALTHLDLSHNKMSSLDERITNFKHLKLLHLGNNNFPLCLQEIIKNANIEGLFKWVIAESENSQNLLRQMCEIFIKEATPETWPQVSQRLGLTEEISQRIEEEFPGGFNFKRRVRLSLECWTGLVLAESRQDGDHLKTRSFGTLTVKSSSKSSSSIDDFGTLAAEGELERKAEETATEGTIQRTNLRLSLPTVEDKEALRSQTIPKTLTAAITGPKATPERFYHVLRLLRLDNLADAVGRVFESAWIHHV
ncbi:hypothetical protein SprV_0401611000 [Sparganum proliferum]